MRLALIALLVGLNAVAGPAVGQGVGAPAAAPEVRDLSELLAPIIARHDIPGMSAAIVQGERVVAHGCAGVRKAGGGEKIAITDQFHLGSCTKSMTATMIATLVEEGKLQWTTTLGEVFTDVKMDEKWKGVRLEQLLTNSGGAPNGLDADGLWGRLWNHTGTPTEQRRALVEGVLARAPGVEPGTKFVYSNAGFAIAGAMAERVTGVAWEELMRQRLFEPLGMTSAGFGAPGTRERVDEPRGHRENGTPVEPGPGSDNPAAIGPGGTVRCTIDDWGKYVALQLQGARGKGRMLKAETFTKLHTPPALAGAKSTYAMGWGTPMRDWAKREGGTGRVLTHNGSNTMWFCVTWLAPEKDFAVLVACNKGGKEAGTACDEAAWAVISAQLELAKTGGK